MESAQGRVYLEYELLTPCEQVARWYGLSTMVMKRSDAVPGFPARDGPGTLMSGGKDSQQNR